MSDETTSLSALRQEYRRAGLSERDLAADPFTQFQAWLSAALGAHVMEPNAMALATADADGAPSVRMVLLKVVDARGFGFFTNLESTKGRQLDANPRAALCFHWDEVQRQVTVRGPVERVPDDEADVYFASRPPGSRLGAWASRQSTVIPSRAVLEKAMREVTDRFQPDAIPRPPFWGGFRCVPDTVEFWQGRPDRLHDRLRYRRDDGEWVVERLSP
jgi:pyridoxamine 5'-phosphate oxidase